MASSQLRVAPYDPLLDAEALAELRRRLAATRLSPSPVSIFGGERIPFPKPPREMVARSFNVVRWAEHDRGGHFPAVAEPELLVDILRATFRSLQ